MPTQGAAGHDHFHDVGEKSLRVSVREPSQGDLSPGQGTCVADPDLE